MRRLLPLLLLLAACGQGDALRAVPTDLREGQGTVLANADHGPELCWGVEESYPPQCGGVPLAGWDWAQVEHESADGVQWGEYRVRGRWDGTTLTVTEVLGPPRYDRGASTFPCPDREEAVDPGRAGEDDRGATVEAARARPEHAGLWVSDDALVLATTGDVDAERILARKTWGGPLCVVQHERSLEELLRVQEELPGEELGLVVLSSATLEVENVVEVGVVDVVDGAQQELDRRYGAGTVVLVPQLEPVA